MLIRASERPDVTAPEDDLVLRALLRADECPELSVTQVRLAGRHRPLRTYRSTRVYYVLEGAAEFAVGGAEPVRAESGDVVVVPRGERYWLAGNLSYLVVNAPAFVEGDDVYDE
jgi:mannose-6-phosphate isomerase-like protein (cupin superfamily)